MRRNVLGHNGAGGHDGSLTHAHAVGDDRARTYPDAILDHNTLSCDALLNKGPLRIIEDVIDRDDLYQR